jgi:hypothetical protein
MLKRRKRDGIHFQILCQKCHISPSTSSCPPSTVKKLNTYYSEGACAAGIRPTHNTLSQWRTRSHTNLHWHIWEPRYQRLQKYAHKRLNLVFLGREVECNSCKHWAAEVCTTSAWYWQCCYKPLLISASTNTNLVTEINSLFTYAKHSTPKPSFAKKQLAKANRD